MGDGDFAAEFAVDLDGDFEHVLAGEVFVADGPGLFENRAGVAEAGPEFLGGERGETCPSRPEVATRPPRSVGAARPETPQGPVPCPRRPGAQLVGRAAQGLGFTRIKALFYLIKLSSISAKLRLEWPYSPRSCESWHRCCVAIRQLAVDRAHPALGRV